MADFQTSTHRERWIFSEQDLMEKREAANQRAIKMLEQYGSTRLVVDVDGSLSYPDPLHGSKDNADRHSLPKPLNCEEEQLMRIFYEQKIQEVCRAFRFPHKIQATAIIYFKRFYLQWSVMEHQPKYIMLTSIYSSCKVEENHVSAEELGKGIQQDHQIILNNEMIVLQNLGFDLIVYAPYRSIEGFVEDMEEFCQARDDEQEKFKELRKAAKSEVDRMMLTDAPLLFPPGQLALAALHRSNEVLRVLDFERYLESMLSQQGAHTIPEFTQTMAAIDLLCFLVRVLLRSLCTKAGSHKQAHGVLVKDGHAGSTRAHRSNCGMKCSGSCLASTPVHKGGIPQGKASNVVVQLIRVWGLFASASRGARASTWRGHTSAALMSRGVHVLKFELSTYGGWLHNRVHNALGKLKIPTAKDMRHIDRKLKSCWDPSSQDENKKREKRSKHKSKRTAAEMQGGPA